MVWLCERSESERECASADWIPESGRSSSARTAGSCRSWSFGAATAGWFGSEGCLGPRASFLNLLGEAWLSSRPDRSGGSFSNFATLGSRSSLAADCSGSEPCARSLLGGDLARRGSGGSGSSWHWRVEMTLRESGFSDLALLPTPGGRSIGGPG